MPAPRRTAATVRKGALAFATLLVHSVAEGKILKSTKHTIALLEGDCIGPEIVKEAVKVLRAVEGMADVIRRLR